MKSIHPMTSWACFHEVMMLCHDAMSWSYVMPRWYIRRHLDGKKNKKQKWTGSLRYGLLSEILPAVQKALIRMVVLTFTNDLAFTNRVELRWWPGSLSNFYVSPCHDAKSCFSRNWQVLVIAAQVHRGNLSWHINFSLGRSFSWDAELVLTLYHVCVIMPYHATSPCHDAM